ncbi:COG3014 family protein [Flavobacterium beibuense]|uniref:Lipoprotein n=1 Tax=Flavobacterium beibuense TaxID=657326 RepID=A0A444W9Z8_9FLAO|nr:hypothetical protein [Flavobacterium beibuense]RYJ42729.1 hypothetical protein NU09_1828 [Flavobacterium beibuense]
MKATKNILLMPAKLALLLLLISFQSCSTYNTKTADIESDLFNGDFSNAIASIDNNKFLNKDRNRLLYLLEKGKVEHLNGNYENSNALLEEAYIMIEDRMTKTNVGQAVSAKFTNPMAEPYKGEDFEKVTIHYYKALNYFQLGQPAEALVEAKRINIKLYELNEKYKENKNKYSEDAFSQILQGILYESTGDINNAFIAYRNAEEIYARNGDQFFGVPTPLQLKKDLMRTSKAMGFQEDYETYRKKFGFPEDPKPAAPAKTTKKGKGKSKPAPEPAAVAQPVAPVVTGEAIVFWENGLGPAKDQIVITASGTDGFFYGTYYDGATQEEIIIPIPVGFDIGSVNAIAIPKYRQRYSYYTRAAVEVGNEDLTFELAQDFYPIAKQCLKDRMLRETIDLVARFATKKAASAGLGALGKELFGDTAGDLMKLGGDIAGAATEKADTRNWQTLPATISYIRVPLQEGENKFLIKKQGPQGIDTDTLYIPYKKGLQIVNYFDLGRTQLLPPPGTATSQAVAETYTQLSDSKSSLLAAKSDKPADIPAKNSISIPAETTPLTTVKDGITTTTVINNYIKAAGGEDKIKGIETMVMKTSSVSSFEGKTTTVTMVTKMDKTNNCSVKSYTDGKESFSMVVNDNGGYMEMGGSRTKLDKKTYNSVKNGRNFYQNYTVPLSDPNAKLQGITSINNQEAYAVSYKDSNYGTDMTNYYCTKTGLIIASNAKIDNTSSTSYFTDYREVNGIMFPFKTITVTNGVTSEMVTTELLVNQGVYEDDFQ